MRFLFFLQKHHKYHQSIAYERILASYKSENNTYIAEVLIVSGADVNAKANTLRRVDAKNGSIDYPAIQAAF